jgi:hypothetical protein
MYKIETKASGDLGFVEAWSHLEWAEAELECCFSDEAARKGRPASETHFPNQIERDLGQPKSET